MTKKAKFQYRLGDFVRVCGLCPFWSWRSQREGRTWGMVTVTRQSVFVCFCVFVFLCFFVCVLVCLCVCVFVCLCLQTLPLLEAITERGQDMAHGHKAIRSDQTDGWSHTLPRHNMCCSYIDITHLEGAIFDTCSSILGGIHMQYTRPLMRSSFNQKGSFRGLFHITTRSLDILRPIIF